MNIDKKTFISALKFVEPCMASNDVRYYLNGVCFDSDGEKTTLVATNGHIIAALIIDLALPKGSYIVPRDGIKGLLKTLKKPLKKESPTIDVSISDRITFTDAGISLTLDLVDGTYPDWRKIMEKASKHKHKKHHSGDVGINAEYLGTVAQCAKAIGSFRGLKMKVVSPNEVIIFDVPPNPKFDDARIAVMPMRL